MSNFLNEPDFSYDLQTGQQTEQDVATILEQYGYTVQLNESEDHEQLKKYDLTYTDSEGVSLTAEVKYDKKASTTGNVAFEVSYEDNTGEHDSGVFTSESDTWIQRVGDRYYSIPTATLRDLLDRPPRSFKYRIAKGGDNNRFNLYLVDIKDFVKRAKLIGYHTEYGPIKRFGHDKI